MNPCFHCGDDCNSHLISHDNKEFCCYGCKTVYEILKENDLSYYYDLQTNPGKTPKDIEEKFDFLNNKDIESKLLEFNEQGTKIVSLIIPSIHCSSCIWVLENLNRLNKAVRYSQVNFPDKTVRITFASNETTLKDIAVLLSRIGYEPYISLEDYSKKDSKIDRGLIYKLGIAGFAFGNIMFLSFPEYFELNEFWLDRFKHVFRWLMFVFAIPVVFYSSQDYFKSAMKGLRSNILNIDVPIAIGISVLFLRSSAEVIMNWGSGFFDSLAGLVFFLLLGKWFQQRTYAYLSFERDYKSYFPIAITRLLNKPIISNNDESPIIENSKSKFTEEQAQVYDLKKGDHILIRNSELLPVDGILLKGNALIDYSFVTGEAEPVHKNCGELLFAGGRQTDGPIEVEVLKEVEQSYLTQLWSNEVFSGKGQSTFKSLTDTISRNFTLSILSIATIATIAWFFIDYRRALDVFTAVLIVACPCAIALAAPFTLGNLIRIFGRHKFYLKDISIIEKLANIDTVIFDKTGTLTTSQQSNIIYEGLSLTEDENTLLTSTLRASNHPLSRSLYNVLDKHKIKTLDDFNQNIGEGVMGAINNHTIKIGSYGYANARRDHVIQPKNSTSIHISTDNQYKGCYIFSSQYRAGIEDVFIELGKSQKLIILSGDNDGEADYLSKFLPKDTHLIFNQKPQDKLNFIKNQQDLGHKVLMIGDGLNDAGALAQSQVGISISEDVNVFTPASDGIIDASRFKDIPKFMQISSQGLRVIKYAFLFSLLYNFIGLAFAVTGNLKPVVAAILMPLSSISIVIFTTLATSYLGRKLKGV